MKFKLFDKRGWKFWFQRRTRGWSDNDTWSLDHTLSKFILPRLKRFRDVQNGYPGGDVKSEEEWLEILDKMILGMELSARGQWDCTDKEEHKKALEGMKLFGEYYFDLWW